MSILDKRDQLLEQLDDIYSKEYQTKSDRRQCHIIYRRLCEKKVTIDLDEEPEFEIENF